MAKSKHDPTHRSLITNRPISNHNENLPKNRQDQKTGETTSAITFRPPSQSTPLITIEQFLTLAFATHILCRRRASRVAETLDPNDREVTIWDFHRRRRPPSRRHQNLKTSRSIDSTRECCDSITGRRIREVETTTYQKPKHVGRQWQWQMFYLPRINTLERRCDSSLSFRGM